MSIPQPSNDIALHCQTPYIGFTFSSLANDNNIYWFHMQQVATRNSNIKREQEEMREKQRNMYRNKQITLTHSQHSYII